MSRTMDKRDSSGYLRPLGGDNCSENSESLCSCEHLVVNTIDVPAQIPFPCNHGDGNVFCFGASGHSAVCKASTVKADNSSCHITVASPPICGTPGDESRTSSGLICNLVTSNGAASCSIGSLGFISQSLVSLGSQIQKRAPFPLPGYAACGMMLLSGVVVIAGYAPPEMSGKAVCPKEREASCESCVPCLRAVREAQETAMMAGNRNVTEGSELADWSRGAGACECRFLINVHSNASETLNRLSVPQAMGTWTSIVFKTLLDGLITWYPYQRVLEMPSKDYFSGCALLCVASSSLKFAAATAETGTHPNVVLLALRAFVHNTLLLVMPPVVYANTYRDRLKSKGAFAIFALFWLACTAGYVGESFPNTDDLRKKLVKYAPVPIFLVLIAFVIYHKLAQSGHAHSTAYTSMYAMSVYFLPFVLIGSFRELHDDVVIRLFMWYAMCTIMRLVVALIAMGAFHSYDQIAFLFPMQFVEDFMASIQVLSMRSFTDKYWILLAVSVLWELFRDAFLGRSLRVAFDFVSSKGVGFCGCLGVGAAGALGLGAAASGLAGEVVGSALNMADNFDARGIDKERRGLIAHERQYLKDSQNVVGEVLAMLFVVILASFACFLPGLEYQINSTPLHQLHGVLVRTLVEVAKCALVFEINRRMLTRDMVNYRSRPKDLTAAQPMSAMVNNARELEQLHLHRFTYWFTVVACYLVTISTILLRTSDSVTGPL